MRKLAISVFIILVLVLGMTSCGQEEVNEGDNLSVQSEVALIIDGQTVNDKSFNQVTWESIKAFCTAKKIGCEYYDADKHETKVYLEAIDRAIEGGNKLIVLSGVQFEEAVYEAQTKYPDTYFLLIDGVPHDEESNYDTKENTIGILFSEEEAGYLAGYASVLDGYRHLAFMGGKEVPAVERYGYGYVQGARDAAKEINVSVKMDYKYSGTFDESDEVVTACEEWYKNGTEVIFACGGNMNSSVIQAAENCNGKVIGVDTDQSMLSEKVITSAEKNLNKGVENVLKNYVRGNFGGGSVFNYAARNEGVALEMVNARFNSFSGAQYDVVMNNLKDGKIEIKKDTDVNSVKDLEDKYLKVL